MREGESTSSLREDDRNAAFSSFRIEHQTGRRRLHHPIVGDLELEYEVMELAGENGLRLALFTAEPNTRCAEALSLLAS